MSDPGRGDLDEMRPKKVVCGCQYSHVGGRLISETFEQKTVVNLRLKNDEAEVNCSKMG